MYGCRGSKSVSLVYVMLGVEGKEGMGICVDVVCVVGDKVSMKPLAVGSRCRVRFYWG
jgi:hypothetical protein